MCCRYCIDNYYTNNILYIYHISYIHIHHTLYRGSSSRRHWSDNIKLRQIPLDLIHMPPLTDTVHNTTSNTSSSNLTQRQKGRGRCLVNSSGNIHRKLNLSKDEEEEEEEEEKNGSDSLSVLEEGRQSHSTDAALLSATMSPSKSTDDDTADVYVGIHGSEYVEVKGSDDIDDDEYATGADASGAYDSVGTRRYNPGASSSSNSGYSPLKTSYTTSPILRKKKASYQVSNYFKHLIHSCRLVY